MTDTATAAPILTPSASVLTPPAAPVLPKPPTTWTPASAITYGGAVALFIIGTLTASGVTVPAHVSTEVQLVVGALGSMSGVLAGLVALVSHHSVQKVAIKAGLRTTVSK